jgi:3-dehydroquinate synthase
VADRVSKRIAARAGAQPYEIILGDPLSRFASVFIRLAPPGARIGLITDAAVARRYGQPLQKSLERAGYRTHLLAIPSGERSKTLDQAKKIYSFCAHAKLERQSWLIALGGGVVGDLSGFVAGTFLRGLPYVQVPTTLLAQVDSSIGGKTGVDIAEGKNLVGIFHQPRLIWTDPRMLRSLPRLHWRNGMAEVIKYGVIQDPALFATLEKKMEKLLKGYSADWLPIITRCAELKARVVERDPQETSGWRAILNFGHTVGHAIEAATEYRGYLHGEAISIGMFVAAIISQQQGLLEAVDRIRLGTLLTRAGLPLRVRKPIPRARLMEYLARDKKAADGVVRFVLLQGIGQVKPGQSVSPEVLDMALSTVGL